MTNDDDGFKVELKPFQYDFIYAKEKYPAFVAGWGTGKTMCGISRALIYTKAIPNNLGIIFRKTAKSLFDSTLKDFERYTRLKVNSQRTYIAPNKSGILFRHVDEIGDINQQNINLGWFMIEQGEELATDKEFFMLWGRLRRDVKPTKEFLKLGLPVRSGWVIANAGDHWMRPLWKGHGSIQPSLDQARLVEATTFDNEKNLPADFISDMRKLEVVKPIIYKTFVINDWSIAPDRFVLITDKMNELLKGIQHDYLTTKRIISIDPSEGGDACSIGCLENNKLIEKERTHEKDTMKIVGQALIMGNRNGTDDFVVDGIGIGKPIGDRINELGKRCLIIKSSEASSDPEQWFNLRSEMWGYCQQLMLDKELPYIEDVNVMKQMKAVRYDPKAVNSRGRIKVVPKDETKKLLNESPDDADMFIYGLWGLKQIAEQNVNTDIINRKKRVFSGAGGW